MSVGAELVLDEDQLPLQPPAGGTGGNSFRCIAPPMEPRSVIETPIEFGLQFKQPIGRSRTRTYASLIKSRWLALQCFQRDIARVNVAKPLHAGEVIGLGQPCQSGGTMLAARAADSIAIAARAAP